MARTCDYVFSLKVPDDDTLLTTATSTIAMQKTAEIPNETNVEHNSNEISHANDAVGEFEEEKVDLGTFLLAFDQSVIKDKANHSCSNLFYDNCRCESNESKLEVEFFKSLLKHPVLSKGSKIACEQCQIES